MNRLSYPSFLFTCIPVQIEFSHIFMPIVFFPIFSSCPLADSFANFLLNFLNEGIDKEQVILQLSLKCKNDQKFGSSTAYGTNKFGKIVVFASNQAFRPSPGIILDQANCKVMAEILLPCMCAAGSGPDG